MVDHGRTRTIVNVFMHRDLLLVPIQDVLERVPDLAHDRVTDALELGQFIRLL